MIPREESSLFILYICHEIVETEGLSVHLDKPFAALLSARLGKCLCFGEGEGSGRSGELEFQCHCDLCSCPGIP